MLLLTILLGGSFLALQAYEYMHAYQDLNLRLDSGIYGNTFFLLTGFHGLHVTLGAIFLTVIWLRIMLKNHFTAQNHFGFQAAAWYWHFVDVVWLCLFVFVYVL
jgi:cytochrome c oxidase subunit 3